MDDEFCAFFRENAAYVAESLRRLGVRSGDAEDMTHEVFLAVHRRFADYDRSRAAKPWLFAFALRIASNYRAHASNKRELLAQDSTPLDRADSSPDVFAKLERDAARKQVYDALASIPMERRSVFVMYELDQRPMNEVAETLSIPVATAYSRLRIAREEFTVNVLRKERATGSPLKGSHEHL